MKKKKLFLLASLAAALAMTSCSSFDEPAALDDGGEPLSRAGERAAIVTNVNELKRSLRAQDSEIVIGESFSLTEELQLTYPVTISGTDGVTLTTKAAIICTGDSVKFKNLSINANTPTSKGVIEFGKDNVKIDLYKVNLVQNTPGTSDSGSTVAIGIQNLYSDNTLTITDCDFNLPNNYVRAINAVGTTLVPFNLTIKDSKINCGTNLSFPSVYARLINLGNIKCDNLLIDNSTLQGAYYVVNVNGSSEVTANVVNKSVLDGRAGFNIWSKGFVGNVNNSTIIGHNNYAGPTESFANIVICNTAENCKLNLTDATFKMDVNTEGQTNSQYAVSFRASNQTMTLAGNLDIYTTAANNVGTSFFSANQGVGNISIDQKGLESFMVYTVSPEDIYKLP